MKNLINKNENFKLELYKSIKKLNQKLISIDNVCFANNLSKRSVYRYLKAYRNNDLDYFNIKPKYDKGRTKFNPKEKEKIIKFFLSEYNTSHLTDCCYALKEEKNISITSATLANWLKENLIIYKYAFKQTKRIIKKAIRKVEEEKTVTKRELKKIKNQAYILDYNKVHFEKPRTKFFGEVIEMDASSIIWVKNQPKWHLHLAVDSNSGGIVGAYFDNQETLKGYYKTFEMINNNYGIPTQIFTDKRTIFTAMREGKVCASYTNFAFAMKQIDVLLKQSSIPQAKGKIERLNGIIQAKLPNYLEKNNVNTIKQANELLPRFIEYYNERFKKITKETTKKSVFRKGLSKEKLNHTLAIYAERQFNNGSAIKYKNHTFIAYENNLRVPIEPGTKCHVIETLNNEIFIQIQDKTYCSLLVEKYEKFSSIYEKDKKIEKYIKKNKTVYKPPMNHPWKAKSYQEYQYNLHKNNYRL